MMSCLISINLTVAKSLHNKCGKALLIAEFHDIYRQLRNSLKVNSSNTVIPASYSASGILLIPPYQRGIEGVVKKDSGQAGMTEKSMQR